MVIDAFLVISRFGSIRAVKNRPALNSDEIAVNLKVDIPKEFFERLMPTVNIQLPKESVINTDMEAVISLTAEQVASKLNLEVLDVTDGLRQLIENAKQ